LMLVHAPCTFGSWKLTSRREESKQPLGSISEPMGQLDSIPCALVQSARVGS
jgi:hypothetical protein